jgi:hypothetical protein
MLYSVAELADSPDVAMGLFCAGSRRVPTVQHITTSGIYLASLCALALKLPTNKLSFSILSIVLNILFHHDFSPSLLHGEHTHILTFFI